jgi:glyoxylase-like metal-dependent hydrolase (beta-lactamase superfamily II)
MESTTYYLIETVKKRLFSGDTLFIGDVGDPI